MNLAKYTEKQTFVWQASSQFGFSEIKYESYRAFTLPGKKRLFNSDYQLQVVIVDVTESPIERPKKNKKSSTVGRRNSIHSSHK